MQNRNSPLSPEVFLQDLFTSKAVMTGGVIRRKARDVERFAGMDRFMAEILRRGFHVAENSGQLVIFCNNAPIRWLTSPPGAQSLKDCESKSFEDFGTRARYG
ncbi:hypothetical protein AIOL_003731 [Candidatus Rhodobacter oscarellae]|uniref:Aspartate aminotransferase n=1 Tax=Candidatus Rhodobacter oscarellae TaxID=1675527 RepID=A0A0J9E7Q0_9RHOB|nr:hypothetical protein [Candidatus Rhodobacter lobularis]KMW58752.1 hypothetical protein AIOL_003731 [Candidatus Rhodobacter lobularis]